jgi:type I restriction enzyme S subunit
METRTQKIDLNNLDKSNWRKVKFSDIAINVRKSSKDPLKDGFTKAIGLVHIEPGNLNLLGYTDIEKEGTKFNKIFRKGQFLFGARRAYLRQMARATFDGVCTANIMVFDLKDENLINRDLFEFIIRSDSFINCAINTSEGSLFPNAKWKYIAEYEFLLPPKDQQAKLAELLWAMVEVIESENEVLEKLNNSFLTNRKYFIENGVNQTSQSKKIKFGKICSDWQTEKLNNVCRLISGNAFKSTSFKDSGNYQVLRIGNITEEGINLAKSGVFVTEITTKEVKYLIPKGAIVLSLTGTNGKRDYGFPSLMDSHNQYLLNQRLVMLIADESFLLFEFLFLISKMELFQAKFFLNATGTANQANVSIADVSEIEIPIPSIQEQKLIVYKMNQIRIAIVNSKNQISSSKALQKSLINQVF